MDSEALRKLLVQAAARGIQVTDLLAAAAAQAGVKPTTAGAQTPATVQATAQQASSTHHAGSNGGVGSSPNVGPVSVAAAAKAHNQGHPVATTSARPETSSPQGAATQAPVQSARSKSPNAVAAGQALTAATGPGSTAVPAASAAGSRPATLPLPPTASTGIPTAASRTVVNAAAAITALVMRRMQEKVFTADTGEPASSATAAAEQQEQSGQSAEPSATTADNQSMDALLAAMKTKVKHVEAERAAVSGEDSEEERRRHQRRKSRHEKKRRREKEARRRKSSERHKSRKRRQHTEVAPDAFLSSYINSDAFKVDPANAAALQTVTQTLPQALPQTLPVVMNDGTAVQQVQLAVNPVQPGTVTAPQYGANYMYGATQAANMPAAPVAAAAAENTVANAWTGHSQFAQSPTQTSGYPVPAQGVTAVGVGGQGSAIGYNGSFQTAVPQQSTTAYNAGNNAYPYYQQTPQAAQASHAPTYNANMNAFDTQYNHGAHGQYSGAGTGQYTSSGAGQYASSGSGQYTSSGAAYNQYQFPSSQQFNQSFPQQYVQQNTQRYSQPATQHYSQQNMQYSQSYSQHYPGSRSYSHGNGAASSYSAYLQSSQQHASHLTGAHGHGMMGGGSSYSMNAAAMYNYGSSQLDDPDSYSDTASDTESDPEPEPEPEPEPDPVASGQKIALALQNLAAMIGQDVVVQRPAATTTVPAGVAVHDSSVGASQGKPGLQQLGPQVVNSSTAGADPRRDAPKQAVPAVVHGSAVAAGQGGGTPQQVVSQQQLPGSQPSAGLQLTGSQPSAGSQLTGSQPSAGSQTGQSVGISAAATSIVGEPDMKQQHTAAVVTAVGTEQAGVVATAGAVARSVMETTVGAASVPPAGSMPAQVMGNTSVDANGTPAADAKPVQVAGSAAVDTNSTPTDNTPVQVMESAAVDAKLEAADAEETKPMQVETVMESMDVHANETPVSHQADSKPAQVIKTVAEGTNLTPADSAPVQMEVVPVDTNVTLTDSKPAEVMESVDVGTNGTPADSKSVQEMQSAPFDTTHAPVDDKSAMETAQATEIAPALAIETTAGSKSAQLIASATAGINGAPADSEPAQEMESAPGGTNDTPAVRKPATEHAPATESATARTNRTPTDSTPAQVVESMAVDTNDTPTDSKPVLQSAQATANAAGHTNGTPAESQPETQPAQIVESMAVDTVVAPAASGVLHNTAAALDQGTEQQQALPPSPQVTQPSAAPVISATQMIVNSHPTTADTVLHTPMDVERAVDSTPVSGQHAGSSVGNASTAAGTSTDAIAADNPQPPGVNSSTIVKAESRDMPPPSSSDAATVFQNQQKVPQEVGTSSDIKAEQNGVSLDSNAQVNGAQLQKQDQAAARVEAPTPFSESLPVAAVHEGKAQQPEEPNQCTASQSLPPVYTPTAALEGKADPQQQAAAPASQAQPAATTQAVPLQQVITASLLHKLSVSGNAACISQFSPALLNAGRCTPLTQPHGQALTPAAHLNSQSQLGRAAGAQASNANSTQHPVTGLQTGSIVAASQYPTIGRQSANITATAQYPTTGQQAGNSSAAAQHPTTALQAGNSTATSQHATTGLQPANITATPQHPTTGLPAGNITKASQQPTTGLQSVNIIATSQHPTAGMQSANISAMPQHPTTGLQAANITAASQHPTIGLQSPNISTTTQHPTTGLQAANITAASQHPTTGLQAGSITAMTHQLTTGLQAGSIIATSQHPTTGLPAANITTRIQATVQHIMFSMFHGRLLFMGQGGSFVGHHLMAPQPSGSAAPHQIAAPLPAAASVPNQIVAPQPSGSSAPHQIAAPLPAAASVSNQIVPPQPSGSSAAHHATHTAPLPKPAVHCDPAASILEDHEVQNGDTHVSITFPEEQPNTAHVISDKNGPPVTRSRRKRAQAGMSEQSAVDPQPSALQSQASIASRRRGRRKNSTACASNDFTLPTPTDSNGVVAPASDGGGQDACGRLTRSRRRRRQAGMAASTPNDSAIDSQPIPADSGALPPVRVTRRKRRVEAASQPLVVEVPVSEMEEGNETEDEDGVGNENGVSKSEDTLAASGLVRADSLQGSQQSWTKVKRNVYVGRAANVVKPDAVHVCSCPADGYCGTDCLNRMLLIECTPGFCPCGDRCTNQVIQRRQCPKYVITESGGKGMGLFADEDIPPGTFIEEYMGEVVNVDEVKTRLIKYRTMGLQHTYIMNLSGSEVIDATMKAGLARYANHSCDPNCETQKWQVRGEVVVALVATRYIRKGEEVTYNYNYDWLGGEPTVCQCGAANCWGYLGAQAPDFKDRVEGKGPWRGGDSGSDMLDSNEDEGDLDCDMESEYSSGEEQVRRAAHAARPGLGQVPAMVTAGAQQLVTATSTETKGSGPGTEGNISRQDTGTKNGGQDVEVWVPPTGRRTRGECGVELGRKRRKRAATGKGRGRKRATKKTVQVVEQEPGCGTGSEHADCEPETSSGSEDERKEQAAGRRSSGQKGGGEQQPCGDMNRGTKGGRVTRARALACQPIRDLVSDARMQLEGSVTKQMAAAVLTSSQPDAVCAEVCAEVSAELDAEVSAELDAEVSAGVSVEVCASAEMEAWQQDGTSVLAGHVSNGDGLTSVGGLGIQRHASTLPKEVNCVVHVGSRDTDEVLVDAAAVLTQLSNPQDAEEARTDGGDLAGVLVVEKLVSTDVEPGTVDDKSKEGAGIVLDGVVSVDAAVAGAGAPLAMHLTV